MRRQSCWSLSLQTPRHIWDSKRKGESGGRTPARTHKPRWELEAKARYECLRASIWSRHTWCTTASTINCLIEAEADFWRPVEPLAGKHDKELDLSCDSRWHEVADRRISGT